MYLPEGADFYRIYIDDRHYFYFAFCDDTVVAPGDAEHDQSGR